MIVITMAGDSSRFKNSKYAFPKYETVIKNNTLLTHSVSSLMHIANKSEKYIFIAQAKFQAKNFIYETCKFLNIINFEFIEIDYKTDGQATTAYLVTSKYYQNDERLIIYNIDTIIDSEALGSVMPMGDGWIPIVKTIGAHWSFVEIDVHDNYRVTRIEEKNPISNLATVGLYYFATVELFNKLYSVTYPFNSKIREKYVSALYSTAIKRGLDIFSRELPLDKFYPAGTPEELDRLLIEYKELFN